MSPLDLKYRLRMLTVDHDLTRTDSDQLALCADLLNIVKTVNEALDVIQDSEADYGRFLKQVTLVLEGIVIVLELLNHVTDAQQRQVLMLVDHTLESLAKQTFNYLN